jgi:hypothetical protein
MPIALLLLMLLFSISPCTEAKETKATAEKDFNPETVLLSHFSFRPPSKWQWMHTDKGEGNVLSEITFQVKESAEDARHATVLINLFKPGTDYALPETVASRWKTWFVEVEELPSETVTYGEHKVTFIELAGAYHGPSSKGKKKSASPNYHLYGAVIDDAGGNVISRFYGPASLVKKYKPEFKKMIEEAVKQD